LNWVDAAVVGVVAISALAGFARGFIREVFGIGAWIGAILLAFFFADALRPTTQHWIQDPEIAQAAAYAIIFFPALIVLSILTSAVGNIVRRSMLGGLDRTMGLVFGLARAAVLVSAAYIVWGWLQPPSTWPEPVREARATPYAYALTLWLVHFLPDGYRPGVASPPLPRATSLTDLLQPKPSGRATARP